jgi:phosphomannomutase
VPGGRHESRNWRQECLDFLLDRLPRPEVTVSLLADCGNATGAILGPELLSELGFMVVPLFEELDGRMPNRPSELTPEALTKAGSAMIGYDLGLAWDGDADRIAFLGPSGRPIDPERFAFVILRELTKTDPGGLVANASCGATIERLAARFGRRLWRTPTGTPHLIGRLVAENAAFGMEASGHLVIRSVVPYDDAVAVGAYAAWALAAAHREGLTLDDLLAEVPEQPRRRLVFEVADAAKAGAMKRLDERLLKEFGSESIERLDGLRVRLPHGWVLVRASNTEPGLRLFVEAENKDELEALVARFGELVRSEVAVPPVS